MILWQLKKFLWFLYFVCWISLEAFKDGVQSLHKMWYELCHWDLIFKAHTRQNQLQLQLIGITWWDELDPTYIHIPQRQLQWQSQFSEDLNSDKARNVKRGNLTSFYLVQTTLAAKCMWLWTLSFSLCTYNIYFSRLSFVQVPKVKIYNFWSLHPNHIH